MMSKKGMLKVAVVGAGMFGGSIAKVAVDLDMEAHVLNSSKKDLDMVSQIDGITASLIGFGDGTGKDRDKAKADLKDHLTVIEDNELDRMINTSDIIVVAASSGGGLGSGIAPLLTELLAQRYEEKTFVILTTLPDNSEQYTAIEHSCEFFDELSNVATVVVLDNNKFSGMSTQKLFRTIEEEARTTLRALRGDFISSETDGSDIDEQDLLNTVSQSGRIVTCLYDNVKEAEIEEAGGIIPLMVKLLEKSAHAKLTDDKVILASAISYNLSEEIIDKYEPQIAGDLKDIFGEHITDYRNQCVNTGIDDQYISLILSGLTLPIERLDELKSRAIKSANVIYERKRSESKMTGKELPKGNKLSLGGKSRSTKAPTERLSGSDAYKKLGL